MKAPQFHRMFEYERRLLPNSYLAHLEEGVCSIDQAREKTGATIGYPGWGIIYYLLLSHLDRTKYETVVETGTNWGSTTIVLAQALVDAKCDGKVISVELDGDNVERAKRNVERAGLSDKVQLHAGHSHTVLPDLLRNLEGIRFAFLDASHCYDDVMGEFDIVLPKLADDALVLFDNTYAISEEGEDARVNGALKAIQQKYGGNLLNLEFVSWYTPGLAIWQRKPKL